MPDSFDEQRIRDFARSKNLDLVILKARIDKFHHGKNEYIAETPEGMMSLIVNAEYIFTSSYHGLVFSIIFEKQFAAAFKTNSQCAKTLLSMLGMQERLMRDTQSPFPMDDIICYKNISNLLNRETHISYSIITSNCM